MRKVLSGNEHGERRLVEQPQFSLVGQSEHVNAHFCVFLCRVLITGSDFILNGCRVSE